MIFTKTSLKDFGERLWGPHWAARLAARLGVARSTITRWRDGEQAMPAEIGSEFERAIDDQIALLHSMKKEISWDCLND